MINNQNHWMIMICIYYPNVKKLVAIIGFKKIINNVIENTFFKNI